MHFFNVFTVALALVIGGLIILWIEDYHERKNITPRVPTIDDMTAKDAFAVGCMQCFALIPGTSRSGSTIIGGLVLGLSRKAATEFSFFLAIPTISVPRSGICGSRGTPWPLTVFRPLPWVSW